MNQNQYWQLKQRYEKLKNDLCNPHSYPYLNSILNLPQFVKQNQTLYMKLVNEMRELRNHLKQTAQKREIKIKTSPYYLQNSVSSISSNKNQDVLGDLISKNQILRTNIAMLRQQNQKKQAQQAPIVKQKQQQLKQKKQQVQRLAELNRQLKKSIENQQVLQLYQQKCRECQSLRLVNNDLSVQLKKLITDLNKLTGSDQNPNMFLLSLGIH